MNTSGLLEWLNEAVAGRVFPVNGRARRLSPYLRVHSLSEGITLIVKQVGFDRIQFVILSDQPMDLTKIQIKLKDSNEGPLGILTFTRGEGDFEYWAELSQLASVTVRARFEIKPSKSAS